MDEPKSSVGVPPPNLPVVNPPVIPPKPLALIAPALPKPPILSPSAQSPSPVPQALPHSPPQPQGDITLPRSSIRTMESDIKSAQAGQVPKGVEIKSSILPVENKSVAPAEPVKPAPLPTSSVGVKLGEAEKRTAFLPGQSIVKPVLKPPETKPTSPTISSVIPAPLFKPAPVSPPSAKPSQPSPEATAGKAVPLASLAIPPRQSLFANKKVLILGGVAVILVLAGGFLYFQINDEPEVTLISPTPSVSPTPTLGSGGRSSSTLSSIFGQSSSILIPANGQDKLTSLQNETIAKSNAVSDQNLLIFVKDEATDYKFSSFLDRFNIGFPANLASSVDNNDFNLILTKQTEFFDQNGQLVASSSAQDLLKPKIALTVRVVDAIEAGEQLTVWEDTMIDDLSGFYSLPFPDGDFKLADSVYRGLKIRYNNFPFPDKSLDYAIVTAKNGNDYLIIANSRVQMYSIIDQLLGF